MEMMTVVLLTIILLVFLLMLSIPLPYCFGGALMFMSIFGGVAMKSMFLWGTNQLISSVLLASPLFILAGSFMGSSGIAKRLLDVADAFVGSIRGGLGVVSVVTCALIGAISGSGFTGVSATGPIMIPRMVEQGYPRGYATALVTVSSVLGLLIPPSIVMIMYGWVTETSILAAFLSTLVPGLIITLLFSVINIVWARKFPLVLQEKMKIGPKLKQIQTRTFSAFPALMMPVIILGGIYGGLFTPTEAAAVAAAYAIIIGFLVYRTMDLKSFYGFALESATSIGAIMTMIIFTFMLSQTLVMLQVPQKLIQVIYGVTTNKTIILVIVNLFLFLVGMIVNDTTGMILVAPLLLPLMVGLGVHPVHLGAMMGVNLAMGGITPPYASILYLGMRIGKCEFSDILKPALMFLFFGYVPVVFLTAFVPALALWLPGLAGLL